MYFILHFSFVLLSSFENLMSMLTNDTLLKRTCNWLKSTNLNKPDFIIDNSLELKEVNVIILVNEKDVKMKIINTKTKKTNIHVIEVTNYNFNNLNIEKLENLKKVICLHLIPMIKHDNYDIFIDLFPQSISFNKSYEEAEITKKFISILSSDDRIIIRPISFPLKLYLNEKLWYINFYKQVFNNKIYLYKLNPRNDLFFDIFCSSELLKDIDSLIDLNSQEHNYIINLIEEMKKKSNLTKKIFKIIINNNIKFDIKDPPVLSFTILKCLFKIPCFSDAYNKSDVQPIFSKKLSDILKIPYVIYSKHEYKMADAYYVLDDMNFKQLFKQNEFYNLLDDVSTYFIRNFSRLMYEKFYASLYEVFNNNMKVTNLKYSLTKAFYTFVMRVFLCLRAKINLYIYMIGEKNNAKSFEYFYEAVNRLEIRYYEKKYLERDFEYIKNCNIVVNFNEDVYSYSDNMMIFLSSQQ